MQVHQLIRDSSPGFDSQCSQKFIFDVAEISRRHWLQESGQMRENVDEADQVLAWTNKKYQLTAKEGPTVLRPKGEQRLLA